MSSEFTIVHPAKGRRITSPFGWRRHPISGGRRHHNGTDFGGTFDVLALADGVVVKKGSNMDPRRGFGHSLTIDHGGFTSLYAHGKHASKFNVGDRVSAGDLVYVSGSTGGSTGAHLHLEVRVGGKLVNPVDFINNPSRFVAEPGKLPKLTVDGIAGRKTWTRIQTFLRKEFKYNGRINGRPNREMYKALQRWANSLDV